jgi:hypothetical protein
MNQIYVEANKSYEHGFILIESELRRFIELIRDQIKKINAKPELTFNYRLKYQNGVVAETNQIDTVLSQENDGSKRIISLEIIGRDETKNIISVDFYNLDSDNIQSDYSIKYSIKSTDRDWVFVTSSQIEERILKIKRKKIQFSNRRTSTRLVSFFLPLIFSLVVLFMLLNSVSKRNDYVTEVKQKFENGEIVSTNQLILELEDAKNKEIENLNLISIFLYPGIVIVVLIVIIIIYFLYVGKFYPMYNFCWGDYLEIFKKKESSRKTFNTVVIIGLIVSVIGGIIANLLNLKI